MRKTHGFTSGGKVHPMYRTWANMWQRCTNPKNTRYADYGGRGITVCKRWALFENFLEDMGLPPAGCTLDRKNNDGNYNKRNCRWADALIQARNSRRAVNVCIDGTTLCISEWCRKTGVSYGLYKARVKRGWTQVRALTTPPEVRGLRVYR